MKTLKNYTLFIENKEEKTIEEEKPKRPLNNYQIFFKERLTKKGKTLA